MTRDQYRATIARLGLNSRSAGELLGVSTKAAQAWHQGVTAVPMPVVCLLKIIEDIGLPRARELLARQVRSRGG